MKSHQSLLPSQNQFIQHRGSPHLKIWSQSLQVRLIYLHLYIILGVNEFISLSLVRQSFCSSSWNVIEWCELLARSWISSSSSLLPLSIHLSTTKMNREMRLHVFVSSGSAILTRFYPLFANTPALQGSSSTLRGSYCCRPFQIMQWTIFSYICSCSDA